MPPTLIATATKPRRSCRHASLMRMPPLDGPGGHGVLALIEERTVDRAIRDGIAVEGVAAAPGQVRRAGVLEAHVAGEAVLEVGRVRVGGSAGRDDEGLHARPVGPVALRG